MFYTRINKIKVFDNREGFLGLFNRNAEMRIYSYVRGLKAFTPMPEGLEIFCHFLHEFLNAGTTDPMGLLRCAYNDGFP
jgi:hypothetical protein